MKGSQDAPSERRPRRLSRLLAYALIGLAAFYAIRSLAPQTLGETARRKFLCQLQHHYPDYSVSIRRGIFDPAVGLIFEGLQIADDSDSHRRASREMIRVERLIVVTDIHPDKLLDQQSPLKTRRIVMEGVQANAWLTDTQQISLAKLLPLPKLGPAAPRMDLRRVTLRLLAETPRKRPIGAELDEVVIVNMANDRGGCDKSITIRGSTDFANDLLVRIDTRDDAVDARCLFKGVSLSRDLIERLPRPWAGAASHVNDLQCACDATLALHRSAGGQLNYQLRTTVHDGRLDHPLLPKPIAQLRGIVMCDPTGVTIETSQGTLGDAVLRLSGRVRGHRWPCDADLKIEARGLLLDGRLASSLPAEMQAGWYKLSPLGRIDIDAKLTRAGTQCRTAATVMCNGVDVRYEKFPYPVESLVGRVEIRDGIATAESLNGRIGGSRMQCAFRLPIKPGITSQKSFVAATDGPIPIDKTLLDALTPRGAATTPLETFVRSLHPRGSIQLSNAVWMTDRDGRKTRKVDLRVIGGHLRYDKFAYPLYSVAGRIQIDNELISLTGFRATNANAGIVLCDGTYRLPVQEPESNTYRISDAPLRAESQSHLALNFRATHVRMDESLRSSLPASSQHVWDSISPSGVLDELNVALIQHGAGNPLAMNLTARQHDHEVVTSRSLSLRPASLPYRLDVTGGTVHFDGRQVMIESIRGKHDASTLSADGLCVQDPSGRWQLALNLHSGSRLHPDAELIAALPSQMREAMRALQLRGPVSLRGQTRLALPDLTHPEPAIHWDLVLQLEGNRIADVGPVHSLRGELSVKGVRDELGIRADGDVRIDSLHVDDLQITGIRGPFSIVGDRLHLGGDSTARKIRPGHDAGGKAPSIRGKMFDGTIDLDGEVVLSSGYFDVGLAIRDGQVPTLLADFHHGDNELTGTFSGQTKLQGNLGTTDLLKGSGFASVTGANLYKLPLIVQVLTSLRVTPNEDVAFTDGQVEFTLFADSMTFSDLQIWGDLIALQGGGTLDRRRELDLTFDTRVSPQNTFTRVFRPLSSKRYTLWTIDVRGPLHDLEIERRAFEGALERLFPAIADDDSKSPVRAAGIGKWFR